MESAGSAETPRSCCCLLPVTRALFVPDNTRPVDVRRYNGKYNLYRRVITQIDNLSSLKTEQLNNKFLPIDDAASNTPQRRANRKRKPTTFSAGDVAVDHVE